MSQDQDRTPLVGLKRGFARRCPNCGDGGLFKGYLKVEPICGACGHENGAYRADDGPAYFTVLIIGHLLVGPMLLLPFVQVWNPYLTAAIFLPTVAIGTLTALAFVKGGFIGLQWALKAPAAPPSEL